MASAYKDAQAQNNISRNSQQYSDLDLFFGRKTVGSDINKVTDVLAVKRSFILQSLQSDSLLLSLLSPSVVSSFGALEELQVATVRSGEKGCKLQFHPCSVAICWHQILCSTDDNDDDEEKKVILHSKRLSRKTRNRQAE